MMLRSSMVLRLEMTAGQPPLTAKVYALQKLRCHLCGRPRGYLRKFALCRLCFRKLALEGDVTGVNKSSW